MPNAAGESNPAMARVSRRHVIFPQVGVLKGVIKCMVHARRGSSARYKSALALVISVQSRVLMGP